MKVSPYAGWRSEHAIGIRMTTKSKQSSTWALTAMNTDKSRIEEINGGSDTEKTLADDDLERLSGSIGEFLWQRTNNNYLASFASNASERLRFIVTSSR